jgi:predicted metal-binding membrane protein
MTTTTAPSRPGAGERADRRGRARRQGGALVLAVAAVAWASLLAWDLSPYGRFLDHDALAEANVGPAAIAAVFVAGWVLMLGAMMFPTTYTLIETFTPVARRHGPARRLIGLVLAGYLAAWTAVGFAAFAADLGIHAAVHASPWLEDRSWLVAVAALAGAGAYQLSPIKDRCLTVCRSPHTFVFGRWRGRNAPLESFLLGVDAGRYCIGCCAGLMLVTFAVGMGNLGWMLLLGAAMAAEKLWVRGDRLTVPLGGVLLAAAAVTAFAH